MGQPVSLELTSRRWQRRALPVELCLPCTCHIPSCKRTVRLFRPLPERRRSECAPANKSGTPPGIRTRNIMFLRHARIADSASGANKKPGDLAAHPGSRRRRTKFVASRLLRSRGRARAHRRTRTRSTAALGLSLAAISYKAFRPRRCCRSYANAAVRAALTSKTKKPEALSRSGLAETRQL